MSIGIWIMALSFRVLLGQKEFWIFLFAAGWALFNWPLIALAEGLFWGRMPAILLYIAAIWLFFILLLSLFERRCEE